MFGYRCDSAQIKAEQPGLVVSYPKQIKDVLEFGGFGGRGGRENVFIATFSLWLHVINAPAKLKAFAIGLKQNCF